MTSIYYLPGHGGRLDAGLGAELTSRGFDLTGRQTIGPFRNLTFSEQIDLVANDLRTLFWHEDAKVIANSFGAYLFLHAQTLLALCRFVWNLTTTPKCSEVPLGDQTAAEIRQRKAHRNNHNRQGLTRLVASTC